MQAATAPLTSGIFERLSPLGHLVSAFVDLSELDSTTRKHPDLTPAECAFMVGLHVEKRRRDWLGGRLAAKKAVIRLAELGAFEWRPTSLQDVEVLPSHTREPVVYNPLAHRRVQAQVSISHSGQFAGAVACHVHSPKIGFDLERVQEIDPSLHQVAFRDSEIARIEKAQASSHSVVALVLWTAKEAISKAIGKGLSVCLQDIALALPDDFPSDDTGWLRFGARVRNDDSHFTVETSRRGDYILSLAWASSGSDMWEGSQSR